LPTVEVFFSSLLGFSKPCSDLAALLRAVLRLVFHFSHVETTGLKRPSDLPKTVSFFTGDSKNKNLGFLTSILQKFLIFLALYLFLIPAHQLSNRVLWLLILS
jgi:hypothetical protein